jgi:glycosyltransferase involved in cell wall biosynthesis
MMTTFMQCENASAPVRVIISNTVPQTFYYFTQGQIGYLRERNFEIAAITAPGEYLDKFKEREKIEVFAVPMSREISPLKDIKALYEIIRITSRFRPAIMHGSTPKAGLLTMLAAVVTGVPVRLFFMRGLRFSELVGWKKKVVKLMEWLTCLCAHQVLCTSRSVRELAVQEKICAPENIKVLHHGTGNGIDARRLDPRKFSRSDRLQIKKNHKIPEGALVLLFVGRLVREKGVIELQGAWRTLREDYPDAHLVMAGGMEKEDPVPPEIMENFNNDDRVHLLGHVPDVAPFYAIADVLVHPSYREGIPIAPLEAAAMEVPVVATRIPGCVDAVVDGETGILVPAKDYAALTGAIKSLLDDPALRQKLGPAGRERVLRDFRPEDIWEALCQEYLRLLRDKGLPVPGGRNGAEARGAAADVVGS